MNRWRLAVCTVVLAGLVGGCAGQTLATNNPASRGVDRLIQDVVNAPNGPAEAQSLGRLRDWMADHHMMYHVAVENAQPRDLRAPTGAASDHPLRVTVEIYQGQQIFRTFQFVPRDNRNLTQLGLN